MKKYNYFLSVIWAGHNRSTDLATILKKMEGIISPLVEDYEIIFVDNGSTDNSLDTLRTITQKDGIPNIQVFALTKEVHTDVASWVGLENSLGDFAVVFNPETDDPNMIKQLLEIASTGKDIVFARNLSKSSFSLIYRIFFYFYNSALKKLAGIDLVKDIPTYRLISKKVINYLLQFPTPSYQYRFLAATAGFNKQTISYETPISAHEPKSLRASLERGIGLLISTTKAPMRIVTVCTLFGAVANLMYSIYVLFIAFFKANVAPGWVTMSLQQSGMFFLFSIVLFILGEYILYMANTNSGPNFHIAQEMTSAVIKHREKLNIEVRSNE